MRLFVILLLSLSQQCIAQTNLVPTLDTYMKAEASAKQFSGTVLIMQKGKKVFERSYQYANREWKTPNTETGKYRIGSITKQFTAALILRLEEEGKLSVTDKISKYLPDYPMGDSITIHMLLNHTSGIKNYTSIPGMWQSLHYKYSTDSLINTFKNKPLDFAPGKGWNYSNSGYILLGKIIEKASGKKYLTYLREQIIQRIGLKNTDLEQRDSVYEKQVKGYSYNMGRWLPAGLLEPNNAWAAGSIISTPEDLSIWIKALYEHKVLSAEETRKMLTPENPLTKNYAYGIESDSLLQHPRIWHNGGIHGFSSYLAYYPQEDMTIVCLSNNESFVIDRLGTALGKIMYGQQVEPPYIPKAVKIDPAILGNYVGKYKTTAGKIELVSNGGKLYRRVEGSGDLELKPESNTRFFYADGSDRFVVFEGAAPNLKVYLISGGQKIELIKE
ncbi:MAG: serine hydrolase domain-containing protein [Sphingobacteriales bacterium]|jgi:CubicO group peptidase (beta-lactamase class C family)